MKLGKLNAAIDAAANVYGMTYMGPVALQKGSLKTRLKEYYTEGKGQETNHKLNDEFVFVAEDGPSE